ncbi:MAG: DUF2164 domain-containing protein [Leptospiraceae bacterium]|nr:DUF2164 domain-containing protein [Leptospiraceae bacterium]MCB1318184.1 DUF2164 domain-containing protein [Leptospiraceae bacterium]
MPIKLNKQEADSILPSIQKYFLEEFEIELGDMRAGFVLDYFLAEIGPFAYNKGVSDAESFFNEKVADLPATCYEEELTYWRDK